MLVFRSFSVSWFPLLWVFLFLLSACSKKEAKPDQPLLPDEPLLPDTCPDTKEILISDQELIDLIYSDYKYYDGFYNEPERRNSIYFENTSSIREYSSTRKYICTNDYATALEWSERSARSRSYYWAFYAFRENEKYFEFTRIAVNTLKDTLLCRIYKCDYLDPSMEERSAERWIIGTFNKRPITAANSLELVEFINYIGSYNIGGKKYIANEVCETRDKVRVVLFETGVLYGDWGTHDEISLLQSTYTINKGTGLFERKLEVLKTIKGRGH